MLRATVSVLMRPYICSLPLSSSDRRVDIAVSEVTKWNLEPLRTWDSEVGAFIRTDPSRPDANWPNWFPAISTVMFFGHLRRHGRIFRITVGSQRFPGALIAILQNERWVVDNSQSAVFVWYLTTAPESYWKTVESALGGIPKLLGRAALDVALTLSLDCNANGKVWLHADPRGGPQLSCWYGTACGMTRIGSDMLPRVPPQRVNDGRYFCYTGETGLWSYRDMDRHRLATEGRNL